MATAGLLFSLAGCVEGESIDIQHTKEVDLGEAVDPIELPAEAVDIADPADPIELPAQEIYLGEGSAMLKIERTYDFGAGGIFEMNADFTIQTFHGLVGEPNETNKVFGSDEDEFLAVLIGSGTSGDGHTTTATGPVRYEVDGFFYPRALGIGCEFHLTVTETLLTSQVTEITNTILGVIPSPGLGPDVVTTFEVDFDEQALDFFIFVGEHVTSFTLYDVALPDDTGCSFTG